MKKQIPNQLFNQPELSGKTRISMTQKVLLVLVLMLVFTGAHAQAGQISVPANQTSIMHLDQFLASMRQGSQARSAGASAVEGLIYDLKPTLYVQSGTTNVHGEGLPTVLRTDAASLQSIAGLPAAQIQNVKMAIIRVPAGAPKVDMSVFSGFPSLNYVYIQSEGNVTPATASTLIENQNPNQQVFYSIHEIN